MNYRSTRDPSQQKTASQVIAQGISQEGGLFVPEQLPRLEDRLPELSGMSYQELAREVMEKNKG